jgi:hypothetical protein
MIILFGFRTRLKTVVMLMLACRNGHVAAHRLVKRVRWFTLFFIPVIPLSTKYLTVCSQCGTAVNWNKEDALKAMAEASGPGGGASAPGAIPGQSDPVAPPGSAWGAPAGAGQPGGWGQAADPSAAGAGWGQAAAGGSWGMSGDASAAASGAWHDGGQGQGSMASSPASMGGPPAGWYQDPADPTAQRYWDGQAWTDSVHRAN